MRPTNPAAAMRQPAGPYNQSAVERHVDRMITARQPSPQQPCAQPGGQIPAQYRDQAWEVSVDGN